MYPNHKDHHSHQREKGGLSQIDLPGSIDLFNVCRKALHLSIDSIYHSLFSINFGNSLHGSGPVRNVHGSQLFSRCNVKIPLEYLGFSWSALHLYLKPFGFFTLAFNHQICILLHQLQVYPILHNLFDDSVPQ